MNHAVFLALIATLGTWAITAVGSATVFCVRRPSENKMNAMLGFSAGVMIAASFWSLLEPAIALADAELREPAWLVASVGFLLGAFFLWGSDQILNWVRSVFGENRNTQNRESNEKGQSSFGRVVLLIFSITLHNIPEGLAVGVAFGALGQSGFSAEALTGAITVAVGIGLQNFPEGAAVSFPLFREGKSRRKSFFLGQASGMVEPVAGVVGAIAVTKMQRILPYALSFAAGAMILVAVHELIPECQRNRSANPYLATFGIVAGFAVMMILDVALG